MTSERFTLYNQPGQEFPHLLRDIPGAPEVIHGWGDRSLLSTVCIAIVGTRSPTRAAEEQAFRIAALLARGGYTIVSGLAHGIDIMAHKGALSVDGGRTIAVLSTPLRLNQISPSDHQFWAERILQNGGLLISEYDTPPRDHKEFKKRFVWRDRLQSGLSVCIIPVQFGIHSGTMHTVRSAIAQGRPILIPLPRLDDYRHHPEEYTGNDQIVDELKLKPFGTKTIERLLHVLHDRMEHASAEVHQ